MCWSCSMRMNMAATQSKPSQHDPSLIVHIPYLLQANKNQNVIKRFQNHRANVKPNRCK